MKIIDLKYCIDAKNEFTELEQPCNCYRNTLYLTYNFELYKISFCSHWKNYKIDVNNRDRTFSNYTYSDDFIEYIMNLLNFKWNTPYTYGKYDCNLSDIVKPAKLKDIRLGDIDFIEPIYFEKNIPKYINRISVKDVFNQLIRQYSMDAANEEVCLSSLNPCIFSYNNKLDKLYELYDKELDSYENKLKDINKYIAKKQKCTVNQTLLNIFKLIIKTKQK